MGATSKLRPIIASSSWFKQMICECHLNWAINATCPFLQKLHGQKDGHA